LFLCVLKVGSVMFGSGYVLLAFLRADLAERWQWLTETQLLDAIAVGHFTPGPLPGCCCGDGRWLRKDFISQRRSWSPRFTGVDRTVVVGQVQPAPTSLFWRPRKVLSAAASKRLMIRSQVIVPWAEGLHTRPGIGVAGWGADPDSRRALARAGVKARRSSLR
jgi:hypothetical protein